MKAITVTKTIEEVQGYEASDGTFFTSKEECEKYEKTAKAVISARFKKLIVRDRPMFKVTGDGSIPFTECGEECTVGVVRLNSSEDVMAAQMYMKTTGYGGRDFDESMIGKDILCFLGCCGDEYCVVYGTVDECVERYRKGLESLLKDEEEEEK